MREIRKHITLVEGWLTEMPITAYQLHGDFSKGDSFGHSDYPASAPDHRIVSNPKAIEKFKRAFSRTPFDFSIHLINARAFPPEKGRRWNYYDHITWAAPPKMTPSRIRKLFGHRIEIDPNTINVVLLGNNLDAGMGGSNDQMSGWILAHRIGHAAQLVNKAEDRVRNAYGNMPKEVALIMGWKSPWSWDNGGPDDAKAMREIWSMRSARDDRLTDPESELIAQFIVRGRVTFNRLGNNKADALIDAAETRVNETIHTVLEELVGKLVVL